MTTLGKPCCHMCGEGLAKVTDDCESCGSKCPFTGPGRPMLSEDPIDKS